MLVVTKADLGPIAPARGARPARGAALARRARHAGASPSPRCRRPAGIDELVDALDAHRAALDLAAAPHRARRRLGALADFVAEHGERGLRALGGRRAAERALAEQPAGAPEPALVGRWRSARAARTDAGGGGLSFEAMRIAAPYDPDDALVSELLAPPPLEECRTAVEFWQRRLAGLPRHRFAARREARAMVTRWEARLRAAEEAALPAPDALAAQPPAHRRGRRSCRDPCTGPGRGIGWSAADCW